MPDTLSILNPSPGVAEVRMARPQVFNAFDEAMIGELDAAYAQLAADPAVRVIVLCGEGRHFSAGADLNWMQRASQADEAWNLADARRFAALLQRIDTCAKPTVARIQGAALGGGFGLACVCDVAVAADSASFAVSEARFGILPAVIGPYVTNAVGRRQARRLALSMRRIDAAQALAMGLVHEVVAADALDAAVDRATEELLQGGPAAQREIKQLFAALQVGPVSDDVVDLTARTISRVRGTDEARQGFAAFLSNQPAPWVPR